MDETRSRWWDRFGMTAVLLLIVGFLLATLVPMLSAQGGDAVAKRDDGLPEVVAIEEDDDDGDGDGDAVLAADSRSGAGSNGTNSGDRSIGSRSGNTRTGTTRGTGVSRTVSNSSDRSRATRTGTTRGTGWSRSVSNSS